MMQLILKWLKSGKLGQWLTAALAHRAGRKGANARAQKRDAQNAQDIADRVADTRRIVNGMRGGSDPDKRGYRD